MNTLQEKGWFDALDAVEPPSQEYLAHALTLRVVASLRHYMREHKLTQREVASRMGVTQAQVSKWLNYDSNMTLRTLACFLDALGTDWPEIVLAPKTKTSAQQADRKTRSRSSSHAVTR